MNKVPRFNLRQRPRVSYYEPDEPNLDEYVFCSECGDFVFEYCSIHGPLLVIPDEKVPPNPDVPSFVPRAALTIPRVFLHLNYSRIPGAGLGVFTTLTLPRNVRFGPYRGETTNEIRSSYCWQIRDRNNRPSHVVDASDADSSNWMRYVNCSRHWSEQNLVAYQYRGQMYYRTIKIIPRFTELMVFYGGEFATELDIDLKKYNSPCGYAQKLGAVIQRKVSEGIEKNKEKETKINITKSDKIENRKKSNLNTKSVQKNKNKISKKKTSTKNIKKKSKAINDSPDGKDCTGNLRNEEKTTNVTFNSNDPSTILSHDEAIPIVAPLKNKQETTATPGRLTAEATEVTPTKLAELGITSEDKIECQIKNTNDINFPCQSERNYINEISPPLKCINSADEIVQRTAYAFTNSTDHNKINKISETSVTKDTNGTEFQQKITIQPGNSTMNCIGTDTNNNTHKETRVITKFTCDICPYEANLESTLKNHLLIHANVGHIKLFLCKLCPYASRQRDCLSNHEKTHTGEKPYSCDVCGRKFHQSSHLIIHKRVHTDEKPYSCDVCGRKFNQSGTLINHKRIHTGEKPYSCDVCGRKFNQSGTLINHKRIHTCEKPYSCDVCGRKFNQSSHLIIHKRVHTGEKPYSCDVCGRKFNQSSHLIIHKRVHTGEKPYSCDVCGRKFTYKSALVKHITTAHANFNTTTTTQNGST